MQIPYQKDMPKARTCQGRTTDSVQTPDSAKGGQNKKAPADCKCPFLCEAYFICRKHISLVPSGTNFMKKTSSFDEVISGTPSGIRTLDTLIKSQVL